MAGLEGFHVARPPEDVDKRCDATRIRNYGASAPYLRLTGRQMGARSLTFGI